MMGTDATEVPFDRERIKAILTRFEQSLPANTEQEEGGGGPGMTNLTPRQERIHQLLSEATRPTILEFALETWLLKLKKRRKRRTTTA